jgi:hypothetical protein
MPASQFSSRQIKAFRRLLWAMADIGAARQATDLLIRNFNAFHEGFTARALETGTIVSYARPFGENDGLGSLPQEFRMFDKAELQTYHDRILRSRDVLAAHNNLQETPSLVNPLIPRDTVSKVGIEIERNFQTAWRINPPFLSPNVLAGMIKLFLFQEERIDRAIQTRFRAFLDRHHHAPGRYTLGEDFP